MELRHYRNTETWGQKGQGSWSRASSRVLVQETQVGKTKTRVLPSPAQAGGSA